MTLVLAAATLALPVLFIGEPGYPGGSWRRSVLLLVVLAVIAPAISTLVATTRRAAERLQASELRYRTVFTEAPVPIAIIGVEGKERGRILEVNHPLEALIGGQEGGLVGHSVTEFASDQDIAALGRMLFADEGGRVRNVEVRLRQTAGGTRLISASVALVRHAVGAPLRCVCHFEDVTARRDLVSAVSHDVRTPLATIGAYVQLLESGDAGELTEGQRAMVDVIEENLRRTYAITDDLLALSRVEREAAEHPRTEVLIGDLVEQVVRAVEPSARARHLELRTDVQLDAVRVAGHPGQLDRALSNLLTNAVKFTPEGGTITVRGRMERNAVVLEVSDTGLGIAPEEQEKIFERFYRSDNARRRRISGTGLGLAIAREIAAMHGGTITVASAPGEGATFRLTLPALAAVA
jgi:PAS domain S-box-containing protein